MTGSRVRIDDNSYIKKLDQRGMLDELEHFPEQCQEAYQLRMALKLARGYSRAVKIIICGMGGSAIIGDLLRDYLFLESRVPVVVNRDSRLPAFVDQRTLVFLISYSGNTKETLRNYYEALQRKANIVAITSGGILKKETEKNGLPCVTVRADNLPRASLGLLFFPVLNILQRLNFVGNKQDEIDEVLRLMRTLANRWGQTMPAERNAAKKLALGLQGKIPILYGASSRMDGIARRWKSQINENTKLFASYNSFPEITHNEIECWQNLNSFKKLCKVLILTDAVPYSEDKKRITLGLNLITAKVGPVEHVYPIGKSSLARLFSLVYLGDFVSVYLALLYATDPTPMPMIDFIKRRLGKTGQ